MKLTSFVTLAMKMRAEIKLFYFDFSDSGVVFVKFCISSGIITMLQ